MPDALMNAQLRAKDYGRLGLELPDEAARLLAIINATTAAAHADPMAGVDYDALTAENVADVIREAALTMAVRQGMQQMAGDVGNALGVRVSRAFADDVDRVTGDLRPRFLKAAKVVTDAVAAGLTIETFGNAAKVIAAGPDAAGLYHETKQALAQITAIRGFLHNGRVGAAVAAFVDLTEQANADTLSVAESMFTGLGGDERFLALYALPGIKPALHTPKQAQVVAAKAATLRQMKADAQKAESVAAAQRREESWLRLAGAQR